MKLVVLGWLMLVFYMASASSVSSDGIIPLAQRLPPAPLGSYRKEEMSSYLISVYKENVLWCKHDKLSPECPHCSIKFTTPVTDGPVILKADNFVLLSPAEDGNIKTPYFELLVLACPGPGNHLEYEIDIEGNATCLNEDVMGVERPGITPGVILAVKDMKCKHRVPSYVEVTDRTCAVGKGVIMKIGLKVDNNLYKLLEVCRIVASAETLWSKHILQGIANGDIIPTNISLSSNDSEHHMSIDPDKAISMENQSNRFKSLLGPSKFGHYFDPQKNLLLIQGHLAPTTDLYLWPMVSEVHLNKVPMWQSISEGNWLSIEKEIRDLVHSVKDKFEVFTGTDQVLELEDDSGNLQPISLDSGKMPVPAAIWKVVRNADTDSCMAFVVFNNPHLTQPPPLWCNDICSETNWPSFQSDFKKGYVYCCNVDEIRPNIQHLIHEPLKCESLLVNKIIH